MLLDAQPKLEDLIVTQLASSPGSTVQTIQKRIASKYDHYSVPAIYQELRKLRERAVCVKVGNRYSLRLGWVLEMVALVDQTYTRHIDEIGSSVPLPGEGTKETWKFRNLRSLGQFWTQLILILCAASDDKVCFEWAPHAWFSLSHASEESQFLRAMKHAKNKYYLIVGEDTKFSRDYADALNGIPGEISFAQSPFREEKRYITLIGKFLITVELGEKLNRSIDRLFESEPHDVRTLVQNGLNLFDEVSEIKLTLQNKPAKSKRIRRDFSDFFGIKNR